MVLPLDFEAHFAIYSDLHVLGQRHDLSGNYRKAYSIFCGPEPSVRRANADSR